MSMEVELKGSYFERKDNFEFEIYVETPDNIRKTLFRKRDHLDQKLVLNNPYSNQMCITVGFVLGKTKFFQRVNEEKRYSITPCHLGWHDLLKVCRIRFVNSKGDVKLEVTKLRMRFSMAIPAVDPITGTSSPQTILYSGMEQVAQFYRFINSVNRGMILKAREEGKQFADLIEIIYIDTVQTINGTHNAHGSIFGASRSHSFRGSGNFKGTIKKIPKFYIQTRRRKISDFEFSCGQNILEFETTDGDEADKLNEIDDVVEAEEVNTSCEETTSLEGVPEFIPSAY
jgi:hypothetical protein